MWRLTPSLGIKCNIWGYFLLNSLSIFSLKLSHSHSTFPQFFIIIVFAFSLHFLTLFDRYSLLILSLSSFSAFVLFFAIFSLLTLLSHSFLPLFSHLIFSYFHLSLSDYLILLSHSILFLLSYSPFSLLPFITFTFDLSLGFMPWF